MKKTKKAKNNSKINSQKLKVDEATENINNNELEVEFKKESPLSGTNKTEEEFAEAVVPTRKADQSLNSSVENAKPKSFFKRAVDTMIERQVLQKFFTLIFALLVFGYFYYYTPKHRKILTYMGTMLLMVMVYAEILVIRDHLWVIEGSMREARRWRDIFFDAKSIKWQRIRKMLAMVFAMGIFSYVYIKALGNPIFSFFGVILMITVLYYEILSIRDEVHIMSMSIRAQKIEELKGEKKTSSKEEEQE